MDTVNPVAVRATPRAWLPAVVTGGLCLATVVALFVGNGSLVLALAPVLLVLLLWAIWYLPIRGPVLVLLVLAWAVEAPGDAFGAGLILTPWNLLGRLLWGKLNLVIPMSALVMSGFDLLALLVCAGIVRRHARRAPVVSGGWLAARPPFPPFAWRSVAAVVWMAAFGL